MDEVTFVVVGGGIAGVSCAEMLSIIAPSEKTILLTASPVVKAIANLSNLTKLIASFDVKEESASDLQGKHENLQVIVTDPVSEIDHEKHLVKTSNGEQFHYKYLCLCTGGRPKIIPNGLQNPYVLGIRDTQSVTDFQTRLKEARRILIVGNGGLATEMVYELEAVDIVWAIKDDSISATFFDVGAAEFFADKLSSSSSNDDRDCPTKRLRYSVSEEKGDYKGGALGPDWHRHIGTKGVNAGSKRVYVEYECDVVRVLTKKERTLIKEKVDIFGDDDQDWNVYVELSNGKIVGCDFVVSATGVQPNGNEIEVTSGALDLSKDGAIIVDEQMMTNLPHIYAAGDVCKANWNHSQHWFQMRLWTQARQMGMYAAQCMEVAFRTQDQDKKDPDFCFEMFTHATKFFGYKVILLGLFNGQKGIKYEVLLRVTKGKEYVKVVMSEDGRMQGAILVGETDLEETFENLILNQMDLSVYGVDLLDPNIDIEDYFD